MTCFSPRPGSQFQGMQERAALQLNNARFEELSNTLVNPMAHGLPAVSFDCDTSPRGMIRHDVDGLPIPLGDVAGLMSALVDGRCRSQGSICRSGA